MKNSWPESPPREPWLPPTLSEKSKVVLPPLVLEPLTWKTQLNQRPARHECTSAVCEASAP